MQEASEARRALIRRIFPSQAFNSTSRCSGGDGSGAGAKEPELPPSLVRQHFAATCPRSVPGQGLPQKAPTEHRDVGMTLPSGRSGAPFPTPLLEAEL